LIEEWRAVSEKGFLLLAITTSGVMLSKVCATWCFYRSMRYQLVRSL
jgi:hypothetical protein